jgi:hypothetical protein
MQGQRPTQQDLARIRAILAAAMPPGVHVQLVAAIPLNPDAEGGPLEAHFELCRLRAI